MRNPAHSGRGGWTLALCLLAGVATAVRSAAVVPDVIVQGFVAGGREQALTLARESSGRPPAGSAGSSLAYEPIRIPLPAQSLNFTLAPNPRAATEPIRIQYRLEGKDEDWQELEGLMWLSLRFLDASGQRISSASLPRTGRSPGWNGDPQSSPFRTSSETVVVPPRARRLQVFMISGGSPRTTGIWLVKGLRLFASGTQAGHETLLLEERLEEGVDLGQPEGALAHWRREGTNSRTPQVYTLPTPDPTHALALIDTDGRNSGSWVAAGRNLIEVEPGLTIRVEADELFSIGRGGDSICSYQNLGAGRYVFRAIPVDAYGRQQGVGVRLPFVLVPPFYASGWFWAILVAAGTAALTGGVRYVTWKRMRRQLERSEHRRAIEEERMRIAQDIHDDMGARLTRISLLSTHALRSTPAGSPIHGELKRMDAAAREVAIALDEIVWAVNPAHDTLEGLSNYISQYVTEIMAQSERRCRLEIPALLPPRFISSGVRHHLLMAIKEALNNTLKHSGATEVRVRLVFTDPTLTLVIADDGGGFDSRVAVPGNGIANMHRRLQSAGGACEIQSSAGAGTTVTFTLTLAPEAPFR